MKLNEFVNKLTDALNANHTISFFCNCKITYEGRAQASLSQGDRIIVIKEDNSLLVHQPIGSVPVNYMKQNSDIKVSFSNKLANIRSKNPKFKDELNIQISKVYGFQSFKLEDGQKLILAGSEKDMSDMIKNNPNLVSNNFIPLSREEHTKFGFIDVFGHDNEGNLIIVECKRYTAGLSAVQQLRRYVEKVMELKGLPNNRIKGVLASPDIAKNALEMLSKFGYSHVAISPPNQFNNISDSQKNLFEY